MVIRGGVCLLALSVVLAGCSGEEPPSALPPLPSAEASVSATPAIVATPAAAQVQSAEGAAAFARFYFDVLNSAFAGADAAQVRSLSDSGCGGCKALIEAIEEPLSPGERIEGGDYAVTFAESPPLETDGVVVDLRYSLSPVRVLGEGGELIRSVPAVMDVDAQLRVGWIQDRWVVRGFRNL